MRFLRRLLFTVFFLLLGLLALGIWWSQAPLPLRQPAPDAPVEFRIPPGSSLLAAIGQMRAAGVETPVWPLRLLARLKRAETGIKAGSYAVHAGVTPLELLDKLTRGQFTQGESVLIEGWTFAQWRARLDAHPDLRHDTLGWPETELAARLGLPYLEGRFFPDTYLFDKQSSDLELLTRAAGAMQRQLAAQWTARAPGLPYRSADEALIMASIIEKETGRAADRPLIAAVFVNRLRAGMRLQTDPTVIYGLGSAFDGNLRKADLLADTPFNTYTRAGLPPTPIAMPGQAALLAALNPAASEALYFVAKGDGSSLFSRTLDEHNRAVNRYQRGSQKEKGENR